MLAQLDRADDAREVLRRSADAYRQLGQAEKAQQVNKIVEQLRTSS
jgi:hypothetical protein